MNKQLFVFLTLPCLFLISCGNAYGLPGKEISKEEALEIVSNYSQETVNAKYEPVGKMDIVVTIVESEGELALLMGKEGDILYEESDPEGMDAIVVDVSSFEKIPDDASFYQHENALSIGAIVNVEEFIGSLEDLEGEIAFDGIELTFDEVILTAQINGDGLLTNANLDFKIFFSEESYLRVEAHLDVTYVLK